MCYYLNVHFQGQTVNSARTNFDRIDFITVLHTKLPTEASRPFAEEGSLVLSAVFLAISIVKKM